MTGARRARGRGWETRPEEMNMQVMMMSESFLLVLPDQAAWRFKFPFCQVFPGVFSNGVRSCQSWILMDLGGGIGKGSLFHQ